MSSCGNRLEMETPVWCILIHVCVYRYMYIQIHQQHKDMALCVCVCVCIHQFSSVSQSRPTLCNPMDGSSPGLSVHYQLLEVPQMHIHWVGDTIQSSHPLLSPSSPTFNLSQHQGISNESILCIRWPNYWSFSFSISPSIEYSGLISFRMDWLDLLAVQRTLKVFSNTTVQKHQFLGAQLSL